MPASPAIINEYVEFGAKIVDGQIEWMCALAVVQKSVAKETITDLLKTFH